MFCHRMDKRHTPARNVKHINKYHDFHFSLSIQLLHCNFYVLELHTVFVFLILQPCSKLKDVFLRKSKSLSEASKRRPSPSPSTRRAPA
jgi:hypothetical protein